VRSSLDRVEHGLDTYLLKPIAKRERVLWWQHLVC